MARRHTILVAVVVLLAGPRGARAQDGATHTITLKAYENVALVDIALGADGRLELAPQASVTRANLEPAVLVNHGPDGVLLHPLALAGQVYAASEVRLHPLAHLLGGVAAPAVLIEPGAIVDGSVDTSPVLPPVQEETFVVVFPADSGSDVSVPPFGSRDLAPGRYRDVTVSPRGRLVLHSGSYYLDRLVLFPDSGVEVRGAAGPTRIFAGSAPTLSALWSFRPAYRGLVLVQTGASRVSVAAPFRGALVAASAEVDLANDSGPHLGSFFARAIRVGARARVVYEAPNPLVGLIAPPGTDLQRCADMIRPRDDLAGTDRERAYQVDIARYCSMDGADDCLVELAGRANVDYFLAAGQLVGGALSPAEYLAIVDDRTRKRLAARADRSRACLGQDADGDWVPDPVDACPQTPVLTPTDDSGCTDTRLPEAPDASELKVLFDTKGFLFNAACSGEHVPPRMPAGAFFRPAEPGRGSYILSGRVSNQPPGCPVWYFFEIQDIRPGQPALSYMVAFAEFEETTDLFGLGTPVPGAFIQFNPQPNDAGTRGILGTPPSGGRTIRFRVQAMNGGGLKSGWSEWRITNSDDCRALGLGC